MPDIDQKNGIDMANIASINGQDAPSGGAYDPVADTGTYTETVPTTGMIHYGYAAARPPMNTSSSGSIYSGRFMMENTTTALKSNFSSDKDGIHQIYGLSGLDKNWTKIDCSQYIWAGIEGGRLWMASYSTNFSHQSTNGRTLTQVTSLSGASDTGWTDVSVGTDFLLAINSGKLFVLGTNGDGQLGTGDTSIKTTLTQIGSDTDWYKVAAGNNHSAAIKGASGSRALYTTGENRDGKCGSGDTSGDDTSWFERVSADASEDWTFVEAGQSHTIAIKAGKLFVAGDGRNERFGNNSTSDVTTFTQSGKTDGSTFGTNWVSGTVTYYKSLLINSNGECWYAGSAIYGNGSGNFTNAQSGYHVKTSGNASDGTTGSFGGSDDFTFIGCTRTQSSNSDKFIVAINNNKLYAFGKQGGNDTPFIIPGNTTSSLSQGTVVNSAKNCQVVYPWYGSSSISGMFTYFVDP